MFAVPGWSVSSSLLEKQSQQPLKSASNGAGPPDSNDMTMKSSKKRNRSTGKSKPVEVDPTHLADLWKTVIEGNLKPRIQNAATKHDAKRRKVAKEVKSAERPRDVEAESVAPAKNLKSLKTLVEVKREKKAVLPQRRNITVAKLPSEPLVTTPLPPRELPQLTALQASMRQKLVSARFRHLNQTLYTTPSAHSLQLFQDDPGMFQEYHEGFRRQVEVWPENPVDGYISEIKQRGRQRSLSLGNGKRDTNDITKGAKPSPLPRTEGTCYIADLGCGEANLSTILQSDVKQLKLSIYSYDLQNPSPLITTADIANLPLLDGSIDIAIFCLALMGTNWVDFIEEAFRILRWKGELWVAEIKSRFGRADKRNQRVDHSIGGRRKTKRKAVRTITEESEDADLMAEVDGQENRKQETDTSAFVEVLKRRGFTLDGENAVDLGNKMFVKIRFIKALTPVKGKCVPVPKGMAEAGFETWKKKKPKSKFLEVEEMPISSEASVLKPCVYKLR